MKRPATVAIAGLGTLLWQLNISEPMKGRALFWMISYRIKSRKSFREEEDYMKNIVGFMSDDSYADY